MIKDVHKRIFFLMVTAVNRTDLPYVEPGMFLAIDHNHINDYSGLPNTDFSDIRQSRIFASREDAMSAWNKLKWKWYGVEVDVVEYMAL